MKVFGSLAEAKAGFAPAALAIGNFDGAHLGHQALFAKIHAVARARHLQPSALTFDPHPLRFLRPAAAPGLLYSLPQRLRWLQHYGIAQVLVLPFDSSIAELTPRQFAEEILAETLQTKAVSVGADFRFGKGRAGNIATLCGLGEEFGFTVDVPPTATWRGQVVSSTSVRAALQAGQVRMARHLLGRPFHLSGKVVSGQGIGRKQTVPTLNLAADNEVLPAFGVYITCTLDPQTGRRWNSVTNIGVRPTFAGEGATVETFLLEDLQGAAPEDLELSFLSRIRAEQKFSSPEALKQQILRDVARAQRYFLRSRPLAERYTK